MSNPLEDLGKAIKAGDLEAAAAAYKALTGKSVRPAKKAPPKAKTTARKPAKKAKADPVPPEAAQGAAILVPEPAQGRVPTPATNRFLPGLVELNSTHKFDAKVLPKVARTPRDRPRVDTKPVLVRCAECPAQFEADPLLVNRRVDDEDMKDLCPRCLRGKFGR